MPLPSEPRSPVDTFSKPTSVFLCGNCGAVLNWVAFAIASQTPGGYHWTDVRHGGQLLDPLDPLAQAAIPTDRLNVHMPSELAPSEAPANAAITAGLRPGESVADVEHLADFLRLPEAAREIISIMRSDEQSVVFVLSNAHRLAAFYPSATVAPVIRAILSRGVSVLFTFADTPPEGRFAFEHVWHVNAIDPLFWREGRFRVERGNASDPIAPGTEIKLETLPVVAPMLAGVLDRRTDTAAAQGRRPPP